MSASSKSSPIPWIVRTFGLTTIDPSLPHRLRELAADLERLLDQSVPDAALLRDAPSLDQWTPVFKPGGVSLIGLISGHPTLRGPISMTSPIWAIAADLTWVRTTSRYYRLGTMKVEDVQSDEVGNVH